MTRTDFIALSLELSIRDTSPRERCFRLSLKYFSRLLIDVGTLSRKLTYFVIAGDRIEVAEIENPIFRNAISGSLNAVESVE